VPVNPGLIYPCRDVGALANMLRNVLTDRQKLRDLGKAARRRMDTWSPRENLAGTVEAISSALQRRGS
jgi:hypothetical protein